MIVAMVSACKQTGENEFTQYYHTKEFDSSAKLYEVEAWVKTIKTGLTLRDIKFTKHEK